MSEHSKPIKHVFVPQPPTEQEQQAWDLAAANAQSVRIMHDELTAAQQRVTGYVDQIKLLQAEVDELRAIKFKRFSDQECWIYQGDGEDHLESLVCPVVMSTEQAIKFEHAKQRVAELEADLLDHKTVLRDKRARIEQLKYRVAELEAENARLLKRVNDLEQAIANGMNDATRFVDRNGWLESEHQRLKQENERLRGLLRECREYVPIDLQEFIKAELAKGGG